MVFSLPISNDMQHKDREPSSLSTCCPPHPLLTVSLYNSILGCREVKLGRGCKGTSAWSVVSGACGWEQTRTLSWTARHCHMIPSHSRLVIDVCVIFRMRVRYDQIN
jgi:hypothetical protein